MSGGEHKPSRRRPPRARVPSDADAKPTWLVLCQVYPPDPAAVGQHMADVTEELARRGYRVLVLTSDRGYDDPSIRYTGHEERRGVTVRRLPYSSYGKRRLFARFLGGLLYTLQAAVIGCSERKVCSVLVTTVPPIAPLAALFVSRITGASINYWVMDVHPDQAEALGVVRAGSPAARLLDRMNRWVLARARRVIVLDRFMASRVMQKRDVGRKVSVIPPWPVVQIKEVIDHDVNPYRTREQLGGKFVVMYSGNHGLANPVTTVIQAAERLEDLENLVFLFVGGGIGKAEVEASSSSNIRSLPYEPLENIANSLSAADLHVVSVGEKAVGIVHPCKVYGAMAVGRPILLLGPEECHVTDIFKLGDIGWHVRHGDIDGAEAVLRRIIASEPRELIEKGRRARDILHSHFARTTLCDRFCDVVERRSHLLQIQEGVTEVA